MPILLYLTDKLCVQLSLLRAITGSMQIHFDDYTASFLAKKLLRYITAIKSLATAGSNFNRNCLLTIGNAMLSVDEVYNKHYTSDDEH